MSTFCVQPWFGKDIWRLRNHVPDDPRFCCWMDPDADLEQTKIDLLNGVQASGCTKCWKNEAEGFESRRQIQNRTLDFVQDRDIRFIEQDVRDGNFQTEIYQIEISNICNGTCVTCNSNSSSAWGKLTGKAEYTISDIRYPIDYTTARQISFLGGEPFLERRNLEIMQNLLKAGNTDCVVSFVTNGSIAPSKEFMYMMEQLNTSICLSIDGIEERFEYMRYPLKWSTVLDNINLFKSLTDNVSVSYTVSNVNRIYMKETTEFFDQHNLEYIKNEVQHPVWFSGTEVTQRCIDELNKQDRLKGINRKDYIPEFVEKYEND